MLEISLMFDEVVYWLILGGCENGFCVVDVTYFMFMFICRKILKLVFVILFVLLLVIVIVNGVNIRICVVMSVVG